MQSLLARAASQSRALRHHVTRHAKDFPNRVGASRLQSTTSFVRSAGEDLMPTRAKSSSIIFFGLPVCITFSLGVWQVKRLELKKLLIEERKRDLHLTPLTEADLDTASTQDYRKITISGTLLHKKEMLVGPRSAPKDMPSSVLQWGGSSGFLVITPMRTTSGKVVLVNRGWIPQRLAEREKRPGAKISPLSFLASSTGNVDTADYGDERSTALSLVEFTGVIRSCDEKNRFMPENNAAKNDWFYVDVNAMVAAQGLATPEDCCKDFPFIELVEPVPRNGWPYPRSYEDFLQFRTPPSTHVTYATTWFLLSAALALLSRHRIKHATRGQHKAL